MPADFNHLPTIAERLPEIVGKAVRKAAEDVQGRAQVNAPVETGYLKNTIYTVTSDSSNYADRGERGTKAVARHNKKHGTSITRDPMLPEVEPPESPTEAIVAVGANYGLFLEMGTRFMAPRPYLVPALEAVAPTLGEVMRRIIEAGIRDGSLGIEE